jgi:dTMP kinase
LLTQRGRFIVFEGGEGTGKSTQARLLADVLAGATIDVVLTREPGGAPGAEILRRLLLEAPPTSLWTPLSEALLHSAARNEHLERTICPALDQGRWVISDRFADSTVAYQGAGLGLAANVVENLNRLVLGTLQPDLTLILDLVPEEALQRAAARRTSDRYESMGIEFHRRVRAAFLDRARDGGRRYAIVDAARDITEVHEAIRDLVCQRVGIDLTG